MSGKKVNLLKRQHLKTWAKLLSFAILLTENDIVWGAKILGVRIWPSEDYTRITLESDTPLPITQQILTNPDRLVVDVQGLELNPTLKDLVAKVASGKVNVDEDLGVISAPVSSGSRALIEVARGLDEISIHPLDIGLKRPSLDDVFISLTGHVAEEAAPIEPKRGRK